MAKRNKRSKHKNYNNSLSLFSANSYALPEVTSKDIHQAACDIFGSTHYIDYDRLTSSS